jgi:hypothetical protein
MVLSTIFIIFQVIYVFVFDITLTTPLRHNITVRYRHTEHQNNEELHNLKYKQSAGEIYKDSVAWVHKRELYRPSYRRLSAKLVPTLAIEGVAWSAQRIHHSR